MSRLAEALARASLNGWTPPSAPAPAAGDRLAARPGPAPRVQDRPREHRRAPDADHAIGTGRACERIARFLVDGCQRRGARVVLCVPVRPSRSCLTAVVGAAAAAATLTRQPVVLVNAAGNGRNRPAMPAEDAVRGVRVVNDLGSSTAQRLRSLDALASQSGLVLVYGPTAASRDAAVLASEVDAVLLFAPMSGAGLRRAAANVGDERVCGVVAVD